MESSNRFGDTTIKHGDLRVLFCMVMATLFLVSGCRNRGKERQPRQISRTSPTKEVSSSPVEKETRGKGINPSEARLSFQHPYIWVTAGERQAVLDRIATEEGAARLESQLHEKADEAVERHRSDPAAFLRTIPALGGNIGGHRSVFNTAVFSAVLYYLTEEEKYAQFTADILNAYILELAAKTPQETTIVGKHFEDGRWTYPNFGIAYDLIHPFLTKPGTTVYNRQTGQRMAFDNATAQKVVHYIALSALKEWGRPDKHGRNISNHHLLTANGALYPIFCVDDEQERERLFNVFWEKGTWEQASLKNTIIPMFNKHGQGILPESTSYGGMSPLGVLSVIDRIKPELNAITDNVEILEGRFMFPQLVNPDGVYVRYGDSKRYNGNPAGQMHTVRAIAYRKGLTELQRKAEAFLKLYPTNGTPQIKEYGSCHALLSIPPPPFDPDSIDAQGEIKRTIVVKHAGIAVVRNWVDRDNELYGLNGYIGGAHYVHSHCTGIAMELYGAGYVMAANGGMPPAVKDRASPRHANYARIYAGNNTVIVNGTSHGRQQGAWKSKSNVWQNHAVNIASEPLHLEDAISEDFGFATQLLEDKVNNCLQQRTLSVIRTSPTSGYYLDIFRSRSLKEEKFHDYIYHNLGDETLLKNDRLHPFSLAPTDKYDHDIGDIVQSPGWRFFEEEQSTDLTADAARASFKIDYDSRFMHMLIPGGVMREYTKALAPPTREARNGYVKKKTQVLAIRQNGEAWNRPFAVVLEPSLQGTPTVTSLRHLAESGKLVGIEVKSAVDGAAITDVIVEQDKPDASVVLAELDIEFQGRFAIVRTERKGDSERLILYIGEGSRLRCGQYQLMGDEKRQGYVEYPAN